MSGVLVERNGAVARLVLNRPDRGNAVDKALASQLAAAAQVVANETAIRCVVITGAGRLFCAGGDIAAFAAAGDCAGTLLRELADTLHDAVRVLATMPKPLLVLVNGPAAGAGFSLALLGDVVIAGTSAHFTAAYGGIGLTPDGGMSWLLPRLVGLRRAQEIMLTNRRIAADQAAAIGLVTRTVVDADLMAEGAAMAQRLVAAPTLAIGAARGLILAGGTRCLADHLDIEAETIAAAGGRPEAREGIAAFLDGRNADFTLLTGG